MAAVGVSRALTLVTFRAAADCAQAVRVLGFQHVAGLVAAGRARGPLGFAVVLQVVDHALFHVDKGRRAALAVDAGELVIQRTQGADLLQRIETVLRAAAFFHLLRAELAKEAVQVAVELLCRRSVGPFKLAQAQRSVVVDVGGIPGTSEADPGAGSVAIQTRVRKTRKRRAGAATGCVQVVLWVRGVLGLAGGEGGSAAHVAGS